MSNRSLRSGCAATGTPSRHSPSWRIPSGKVTTPRPCSFPARRPSAYRVPSGHALPPCRSVRETTRASLRRIPVIACPPYRLACAPAFAARRFSRHDARSVLCPVAAVSVMVELKPRDRHVPALRERRDERQRFRSLPASVGKDGFAAVRQLPSIRRENLAQHVRARPPAGDVDDMEPRRPVRDAVRVRRSLTSSRRPPIAELARRACNAAAVVLLTAPPPRERCDAAATRASATT